MPHKTTAFFNRNCHDYGAQDEALRQQGFHARHMWNYYYWEVGYKPLPSRYNQIYNKYGK